MAKLRALYSPEVKNKCRELYEKYVKNKCIARHAATDANVAHNQLHVHVLEHCEFYRKLCEIEEKWPTSPCQRIMLTKIKRMFLHWYSQVEREEDETGTIYEW